MQGDLQLARGLAEVIAVVGFVRAQRDQPGILLLLQHLQRGLAFNIAIGHCRHHARDQVGWQQRLDS
jgi:hypothetical protein